MRLGQTMLLCLQDLWTTFAKLGILSGANPSSPSRQRHEDRLACAKFPTDHALADACRTADGPGRRAAKACRVSARPLGPSPPSRCTATEPIVHDAPKFLRIPRPEVCPRPQALGKQQVLREANPPSAADPWPAREPTSLGTRAADIAHKVVRRLPRDVDPACPRSRSASMGSKAVRSASGSRGPGRKLSFWWQLTCRRVARGTGTRRSSLASPSS
mmetsp:Transcript_128252/g.410051  ORF Transcript_128252/g.410051 Transcript_128252/m.410051 type:complete len:216 (+) Transcript_128252:730-1377(+)